MAASVKEGLGVREGGHSVLEEGCYAESVSAHGLSSSSHLKFTAVEIGFITPT